MKIGILTLNGNFNFGNRLQNYALQQYVKQLCSCEIETIINITDYQPKTKLLQKIKLNNILEKIDYIIKFKILYKNKLKNRNDKFIEFSKNIKETVYTISNEKIDNRCKLFDRIIIGSDQVWSPFFYRLSEIDFGMFLEKEKVFSYSASLGADYIPDEFIDLFKRGIANVSMISVRENSGKKILQELTKREDIEVLIDPTMLLTQEEWSKIEKKPSQLKDKKYILNYFLGEISKERKKEIEKIAKENDCQIINILDKKDPFYVSGPSEFLYLERNAFLICTDSFHSCVFAILFNTPFIVFNREDKTVNMNSRIETLLSKFKLENRYYKGKIDKELLKTDYMEAYKILEEERKKSLTFLKKALNIEEI